MATTPPSASLKRLDEQITCSVCLDIYTVPKMLQCHHAYCEGCLEAILHEADDKTVIVCPTCRKGTPVPQEGGVSGLGAAFFVNELMELREPLHSEFTSSMSSIASSMGTSGGSSLDTRCGHTPTPKSVDPQKCEAKGRGVEAATVDMKAVIFMKVQDLRGNPFLGPIPDMECRVISVRTGQITKCEVRNETENVYEISYIPVVQGAHEVHIKIDNMHVRGSPFPVLVRSSVENLGKLTMVLKNMIQPWGIAVHQRDQIIVVSECDGHKVTVFGRDGTKIRSIGTGGRKPLKWPRGIGLDGKGNIFVAEMGNHRVQKFNVKGQLLASAGTVGKGPEQFQDPKGLAFNFVNNKVYVADVHRVQVMNSDLTFHDSFGKQGSGNGQFSNAFSIACDNKGYVYVSDKDNRNIQVFTADGQFLKTFLSQAKWGLWGGGAPVGLAVDGSGHVYVSDNNTQSISVFSPEGVRLKTIGYEFKSPRGIAVTEGGVVYVCDFGNNRVQVF